MQIIGSRRKAQVRPPSSKFEQYERWTDLGSISGLLRSLRAHGIFQSLVFFPLTFFKFRHVEMRTFFSGFWHYHRLHLWSSKQTFLPVYFVLLQFSHSKKAVECLGHLRLNLFRIRVVLYQILLINYIGYLRIGNVFL